MISISETNWMYWKILRTLDPEFLSTVKSFVVFAYKGTDALLLTVDDCVYGVGRNKHGSLGLGHENSVSKPAELVSLRGKQIVSIVCGYAHVLALTGKGEVYSWGYNHKGQLGHWNSERTSSPTLVAEHMVMIACGGWHSLALDTFGQVFACGSNHYGQLGIDDTNVSSVWMSGKVAGLCGQRVKLIECGESHSMAITTTGQLYAWGNNQCGQLGIDSFEQCRVAQLVKWSEEKRVKTVACGREHTLILLYSGEVYSCGSNRFGQLGYPVTSKGSPLPTWVASSIQMVSTHLAENISVAIGGDECLVWGDCGELGQIDHPHPMPLFRSHYAVFALLSERRNTPPKFNQQAAVRGNQLCAMFDHPLTSDVQFEVEGKVIHAHRCILHFHFRSPLNVAFESEDSPILIEEYSYNNFRAFLYYIYADEWSELNDGIEIDQLIDLAKRYLKEEFKHKCLANLPQTFVSTFVSHFECNKKNF